MKRIVNKARRRLGISGRPAIILGPGEDQPISDERLEEIQKNRTVAKWIDAGVLEIVNGTVKQPKKIAPQKPTVIPKSRPKPSDVERVEPLPDGITGDGIELHRTGGWYAVYVNGFKVTDKNVRKDEAERIASEYE